MHVCRNTTQVNSSIIVYLLLAYFSEYCLQAGLADLNWVDFNH